jgi:hypothetical protein
MAKKSNAAKILDYVTAHPNATAKEVAAKFNVSVAYVYVLRSKAKKEHRAAVEKVAGVVPPMPPVPDMVNHPAHYKAGGIETIDFIEAKGLNYHLGNVVKYITRADLKGERKENLLKARWYLDREIAQSAK